MNAQTMAPLIRNRPCLASIHTVALTSTRAELNATGGSYRDSKCARTKLLFHVRASKMLMPMIPLFILVVYRLLVWWIDVSVKTRAVSARLA